jgi:hypothetical protein
MLSSPKTANAGWADATKIAVVDSGLADAGFGRQRRRHRFARTRHHGHELLRKGEHPCHFDAALTDLWRTSRFKEKGLSGHLPPKP